MLSNKKYYFVFLVLAVTLSACSDDEKAATEKLAADNVSAEKTATQVVPAEGIKVTRENYQYAEAIRNAENYVKAGADGKWFHWRNLSPIGPSAPTVRMNLDTLYSAAVLDNSTGNIEVTIPESDLLQTVMVLDEQAYSKHYFQQPGAYKIVSDSPYVIVIARTGVRDRNNEADLEKARQAQDGLLVTGYGSKPFAPTLYNRASLAALTAELNKEFLAGDGVLFYGQFKDDVDESQRLLSSAAGWGGMHDNINTYTSSVTMSGDVCRTVSFDDPKVGEFFSFTMYDDAGYLMDGNTSINSYNMNKNDDGTYTVSFNCGESAINNITSSGREFNYIVRAYAASDIVKSGEWNPISPVSR